MRVQKRNPWLYGLGVVLAAMVLSGSQAGADVTAIDSGSTGNSRIDDLLRDHRLRGS